MCSRRPADPATHSLASTRFPIPRPRKRTSGSSCSRNNDDDKAWEAVVRSGGSDGTERELMPEPDGWARPLPVPVLKTQHCAWEQRFGSGRPAGGHRFLDDLICPTVLHEALTCD